MQQKSSKCKNLINNKKEEKRSASRSYNKPRTKLPTPKHPEKPEASKIISIIKPLFSSSDKIIKYILWIKLEEEQKAIDTLGTDKEYEATKIAKVKDNEEEMNEITISRSSPPLIFENNDLS